MLLLPCKRNKKRYNLPIFPHFCHPSSSHLLFIVFLIFLKINILKDTNIGRWREHDPYIKGVGFKSSQKFHIPIVLGQLFNLKKHIFLSQSSQPKNYVVY
ncbi:hypothetical protein Hanom_Chr12g01089851 [Helianthus anomalus]